MMTTSITSSSVLRTLGKVFVLFSLLWAIPSPLLGQTTVYVDMNNTSANCSVASAISDLDGSNWDCAYPALQDALDKANAGTGAYRIHVAEGTYYPDLDNVANDGVSDGSESSDHSDDSRTESFTIGRDDIQIFGGYPTGGGTRDSDANVVVLSGDIDGGSGDDDVFAPNTDSDGDGNTPTQTDHLNGSNAYHVLEIDGRTNDINSATKIQGVTITAGKANGTYPNNSGGGLYCDARTSSAVCSPRIEDVILQGNAAFFGGGGMFLNTDPSSAGVDAGTSSPELVNVLFDSNTATDFRGGAVNLSIQSGGIVRPSFQKCTFTNNFASSRGGGIHIYAREGATAEPIFSNAVFMGNRSGNGGAIYNFSTDSGTLSAPDFTNTTFFKNGADFDGGSIYNRASGGSAVPNLTNTILWGNQSDDNNSGAGSGDEVFNNGSSAQTSIDYSIVENGNSSGIINDNGGSTNYDSNTNLESDPQFADESDPDGPDNKWATPDDGLQLRGASYPTPSPAIDAGSNSAISATEDLLGNDRTYDGSGDGSATVDLGPYEYNDTPLPVELVQLEAVATAEGTVALQWTTASETNNAEFRVMRKARSEGREAWVQAGSVAGSGTTTAPESYRFADENLPHNADVLQYRLRQVDTDGTTHLSDVVTVERSAPEQVKLRGTYPNPARTQATVELAVPETANAGEATLQLYDVMGRQVRTVDDVSNGRSTVALDVEGLSSGVYVLRLSANGTTRTQRLTVVR